MEHTVRSRAIEISPELRTGAVTQAVCLAKPGDLGGWYLLLFIHMEGYGIQMPVLTVN